MDAGELIDEAFQRLSQRSGFETRASQWQLARLLGDLITEGSTGLFEAPTGLGKSLACLIPAIASAIAAGKRVVIATYTNVLAEQYWTKDLPLALSLFDTIVPAAMLMGRQRYVCQVALEDTLPRRADEFRQAAEQGTLSELNRHIRFDGGNRLRSIDSVGVPPVCEARACPAYDTCYYYKARERVMDAQVIITNHSVVISHALASSLDENRHGLLGKFDFLLLDEAHDFPAAALSGLEFELSHQRLGSLERIASRLHQLGRPLAEASGETAQWNHDHEQFIRRVQRVGRQLEKLGKEASEAGIVAVCPREISEHPATIRMHRPEVLPQVEAISEAIHEACSVYSSKVDQWLAERKSETAAHPVRMVQESARNSIAYIRDFATGAHQLSCPDPASVSSIDPEAGSVSLRRDFIDLAGPLHKLIWSQTPYACLSATLILDGEFDAFQRLTGADAEFKEALPSPYDFARQMAIYLPPEGRIPDPTQCRQSEREHAYYHALAAEISTIIQLCGGRTLALFHSRKEMLAVRDLIRVPDDLPVLVQDRNPQWVGEQFRKNIYASLFALRSFWTGFDAPGETCSCVALVRIPFEVPTTPTQVARLVYLAQQGMDPFAESTLASAKMIMRQGGGRLIRSTEDKGVLALLDPRLRTKRYGESILANFPPGVRTFDDFADAAGWIGVSE